MTLSSDNTYLRANHTISGTQTVNLSVLRIA
jgi:hypothetical protein